MSNTIALYVYTTLLLLLTLIGIISAIHFQISRSGSGFLVIAAIVWQHFSTKEAQPEEDPSVSARLQRLQNNYEDFGMRRTVEGILVVHDHGHPHILMLQIANAFFKLYVKLC